MNDARKRHQTLLLSSAGTFGEVLATGVVPKCAAEASLQLSYDHEADRASPVVTAIVQAAKGAPDLTETRDGASVAILSKAATGVVRSLGFDSVMQAFMNLDLQESPADCPHQILCARLSLDNLQSILVDRHVFE